MKKKLKVFISARTSITPVAARKPTGSSFSFKRFSSCRFYESGCVKLNGRWNFCISPGLKTIWTNSSDRVKVEKKGRISNSFLEPRFRGAGKNLVSSQLPCINKWTLNFLPCVGIFLAWFFCQTRSQRGGGAERKARRSQSRLADYPMAASHLISRVNKGSSAH